MNALAIPLFGLALSSNSSALKSESPSVATVTLGASIPVNSGVLCALLPLPSLPATPVDM